MRQYEQGERFIEAVEGVGGPDLLAKVWEGPEWLPSWPEIRDPAPSGSSRDLGPRLPPARPRLMPAPAGWWPGPATRRRDRCGPRSGRRMPLARRRPAPR